MGAHADGQGHDDGDLDTGVGVAEDARPAFLGRAVHDEVVDDRVRDRLECARAVAAVPQLDTTDPPFM